MTFEELMERLNQPLDARKIWRLTRSYNATRGSVENFTIQDGLDEIKKYEEMIEKLEEHKEEIIQAIREVPDFPQEE
jgi:hypothetical protein